MSAISLAACVISSEHTFTKWSMRDTLPIGPPSAIRRAYSPFLMECTETASVIVSTKPDDSPVMRMRKLILDTFVKKWKHLQADPAFRFFFFPNPPKALDELSSKLLLPQIGTSLDDNRYDLGVSSNSFLRQMGSHPSSPNGPKVKKLECGFSWTSRTL